MRLALLLALLLAPVSARCGIPLRLEVYEDKGATMSAGEVAAKLGSLPWKAVTEPRPSFGFTHSRIWFHFRVPPETLANLAGGALFVQIPNANIDRVAIHFVTNGEVTRTLVTGMGVPVSERGTDVLYGGWPTFRINPPLSAGTDYLISIEGLLPLSMPITLMNGKDFTVHNVNVQLFYGFFLGFLALAVIFNGFIALSLRSRIYLNYSAYVTFIMMMCMADAGLSIPLFWPESPWWALRELHVLGGLALFFYGQFVRRFVASRKVAPWLDKALLFMIAVSTVRSVLVLFDLSQWVIGAGILAVTVSNFLVMAIAVKALIRKIPSARFFLVSSAAFNVGYILFILRASNVIAVGDFLFFAPQFGIALEVCLLSLALADRIRLGNLDLARQKAATVHAEKMSALGRMAGEIAHEISNPLAIIHGHSVLIQKEGDARNMKEFAGVIEHTANRISKLVKGMRALSRDTRRDPFQSVTFESIVQDVQFLCDEKIRQRKVKLIPPSSADGLRLSCRGSEISQVLVNLVSNAIDAVEGQSEPWVRIDAKSSGRDIEIAVTDSGDGIPKELREKIQEPFFTTKEAGKGMGLGLSIARTIVEHHGGSFWLDEKSSRTRFVFTIPSVREG